MNLQRVNRGRNIAPPLPRRKPCKAEQIPGWVTKKELNRKIRFGSFLSKTKGLGMESTPLALHGIAACPRMASADRLYFFGLDSILAVGEIPYALTCVSIHGFAVIWYGGDLI